MHKRFFLPNIVAIIRLSQSNAVTDAIAQIIPFLHGVNLVYEHYLYKKDHVYAGRQHWRCVTTGCPGHVKTDFSDPPLVMRSKNQSHYRRRATSLAKIESVGLCRCAGNSTCISTVGRPTSWQIMFGSVSMINLTIYLAVFFASAHLTIITVPGQRYLHRNKARCNQQIISMTAM